MGFRTDGKRLIAFSGQKCNSITIDGTHYQFADAPVDLTFSPVSSDLSHFQMFVSGEGLVSIPLPEFVQKVDVRFNGKKIFFSYMDHQLILKIDPIYSGQQLDIYLK